MLADHPFETVVLGEEDNQWGQKVCAYVIPMDPSLTKEELYIFCQNNLNLS
ncbi:hypothetical protein ACE1TI_21280 [Alteribacillus sp. JSM 102045]|uniref:hypothetical protein n=1 Tax=Alteribacillus sp. JSM 102045 TaxID=1562101 RepID=UPI0035BF3E34